MAETETHLGKITISPKYLKTLIGHTAAKCFGVADLNPCGFCSDFLSRLNGSKPDSEGVSLREKDGKLEIGLHISVMLGTNISAAADSLAQKIRYTVEESTGLPVSKVNVYVEDIRS